ETVYTDEEGKFEIYQSVPIGDYSVKAELSDYVTEIEAVNIKNFNQTVTVAFEMSSDLSLNSPPDVPNLLTPKDMAKNIPLNVLLTWKGSDPDKDPLTYNVLLKNNKTNKT